MEADADYAASGPTNWPKSALSLVESVEARISAKIASHSSSVIGASLSLDVGASNLRIQVQY